MTCPIPPEALTYGAWGVVALVWVLVFRVLEDVW